MTSISCERVLLPNSFQVPNVVVDSWLPELSPAASKIVVFICRKTFGWHKHTDRISLGQFVKGTGLSRQGVCSSLARLVSIGILHKTVQANGSVWGLNLEADRDAVFDALQAIKLTSQQNLPVSSVHHKQSSKLTETSQLRLPTITQSNPKPNISSEQAFVPFGQPRKTKKPEYAAAIATVFDYYLERVGRQKIAYALTPRRMTTGAARLEDCLRRTGGNLDKAVGLLKHAIDGLVANDWAMGRNSKTNGRKFRDWETHLFGSTEVLEKWWEEGDRS